MKKNIKLYKNIGLVLNIIGFSFELIGIILFIILWYHFGFKIQFLLFTLIGIPFFLVGFLYARLHFISLKENENLEDKGIEICPKCHHQNLLGSKYCSKCGTPLFKACKYCGAEMDKTAKYCSSCGMKY